jgi:CMP-N-acetylneuraminic acid synthetase
MDVCGLIMARGGSKRVPDKNIRPFGQIPGTLDESNNLLKHKINKLKQIKGLGPIYVNSESLKILTLAEAYGAIPIKRDPVYSTDDISINEVYKTLAKSVEHEHIYFAHITSPLVSSFNMQKCFDIYDTMRFNEYDSLATCTKIHKFMWSNKSVPVNYDPKNMPRSQDLPDYYVLNFAVNILPRELMIRNKNIIGDKFMPFWLDELESFDIDNEQEFIMAEYLYGQ